MPNTKRTRVPEKVARPTRTTMMLAIALGLVSLWDEHVFHLSHKMDALLGVSQYGLALGIALAAVNAVWVAIEDRLERGLLRAVPPKDVPAVDDKGRTDLGAIAVVLVIVVLVVVLLRMF